MKKIIIPFFTLLTLVSCRENAGKAYPANANTLTVRNDPRNGNFSVADMLYKFQFDLTTIYGEAFTNKAWH